MGTFEVLTLILAVYAAVLSTVPGTRELASECRTVVLLFDLATAGSHPELVITKSLHEL